jgi:hypothetical protein
MRWIELKLLRKIDSFNIEMMDVRHITDSLFPQVQQFKDEEHTEIELRFGKFNGNMFDTNLGKAQFDSIMNGLSKYTEWDQIIGTEQEVFYRECDGIRITTEEATGEETIIRKERVMNQDFKQIENVPYDLRFSISKEIPLPEDTDREMDKKRTKKRISFVRKNVSIDMTICTGDTHDMDAEDSHTYQIEFEIVDPTRVKTKDDLFKILHKVNDVFIMLCNTR